MVSFLTLLPLNFVKSFLDVLTNIVDEPPLTRSESISMVFTEV